MNERLKQARKALGLSQAEVAKQLDVSQPAYSMIENGTNPLQEKYLKLFCLSFNVNEDWLRTGEGVMQLENGEVKEFEKLVKDLLPENKQSVLNIIRELITVQSNTETAMLDRQEEGE